MLTTLHGFGAVVVGVATVVLVGVVAVVGLDTGVDDSVDDGTELKRSKMC